MTPWFDFLLQNIVGGAGWAMGASAYAVAVYGIARLLGPKLRGRL